MRPLIVGESNPYGGDDQFALYPAPDGCSGHRLCCLILGMGRAEYLDTFDRCNLVQGPWSTRVARSRVLELLDWRRRYILLGAKVAEAFCVDFRPFGVFEDGMILVLPHPSGLNRMWSQDGNVLRAREAVLKFIGSDPCERVARG